MKRFAIFFTMLASILCQAQNEAPFATSPEAEAFYQKAMPVIHPKYKLVIEKMAATLKHKATSADSAKLLMKTLYGSSLTTLSDMDMESLVMLTLMKIDKENQQDLKAMMKAVKQQNAARKTQSAPIVYKEKAIKKDTLNERQLQLEKQKATSRSQTEELAEDKQLKMQLLMERRSKAMETISNIMKKISSTQDSIINNLK